MQAVHRNESKSNCMRIPGDEGTKGIESMRE